MSKTPTGIKQQDHVGREATSLHSRSFEDRHPLRNAVIEDLDVIRAEFRRVAAFSAPVFRRWVEGEIHCHQFRFREEGWRRCHSFRRTELLRLGLLLSAPDRRGHTELRQQYPQSQTGRQSAPAKGYEPIVIRGMRHFHGDFRRISRNADSSEVATRPAKLDTTLPWRLTNNTVGVARTPRFAASAGRICPLQLNWHSKF